MATLSHAFSLLIFTTLILHSFGQTKTLSLMNNCGYTVWPAIGTSVTTLSNDDSGFALLEGESKEVLVPSGWGGRVWGRSLCSTNKSTGIFYCQTGDCGTKVIQCADSYADPVTVAEFTLGGYDNKDVYDVSVVDGYNLPLMVAPLAESGSGATCTATGCVFDLKGSCPAVLQVVSKTPNDISSIVGCNSACKVFNTDQYCCNNVSDCQRSDLSLSSFIFKRPCPRAYSFTSDYVTSSHVCDTSRASLYNITFCPSTTMARSLALPASPTFQPAPSPIPALTQAPSPSIVLSPIPSSPAINLTTNHTHDNSSGHNGKRKLHTSLIVAIPTTAVILILMLLGICIFNCRKKAIEQNNVETNEMRKFADSLQFEFNTIRLATRNFAAENKLGEGGFGEVYKGKLEGGQEIAVKRLSKNSVQGVAEFETEIVLVAKLQHNNLVRLLGYCSAPNESLLVYEFLPNSSLDRFLSDPVRKASLNWETRFKIITGIAKGLMYLHEDSPIKVIHRDLKSSNILLDEDMKPKIADFGLARLFRSDQTQGDTKKIVGTHGYMAPEYVETGHYSVKSDVYSFGVLVIEIVSGQMNRLFRRLQHDEAVLHRAWRLWIENNALNLIDMVLEDNIKREEVLTCIQIGLLCIQKKAVDRPTMAWVVASLNRQSIDLPTPKLPLFFGVANGEAPDMVDGYTAPYVYTGPETITSIYSRD